MTVPERRNKKKSRRQRYHAPHLHLKPLLGEVSPLATGGVGISDTIRRPGISDRVRRLDEEPRSFEDSLDEIRHPGDWLENEYLEAGFGEGIFTEPRLLVDYNEPTDGDDGDDGDDGEEYLEPGDYYEEEGY